jgi:hypothetical protein
MKKTVSAYSWITFFWRRYANQQKFEYESIGIILQTHRGPWKKGNLPGILECKEENWAKRPVVRDYAGKKWEEKPPCSLLEENRSEILLFPLKTEIGL